MIKNFPYWQAYAKEMGGWLDYAAEITIDYKQCVMEGRDVAALEPVMRDIAALSPGDIKKTLAEAFFDAAQMAELRADFPYVEPSGLDEIKAARPQNRRKFEKPASGESIREKISGAWYGRICGCLLGKPVEGWRSSHIREFAEAQGDFPLVRYLHSDPATSERLGHGKGWYHIDTLNGFSPADDDTNYTVTAMKLIERYGRGFTPDNMAMEWLENMTIFPYCTAERVAYRNLIAGLKPPYSAVYLNPYREYIGAQIRGDYFGYVNPGDPETAAEMAWRDASISHVKNGIYGEMFVAAALAAAAVCDDPMVVLEAGIAEVPEKSRLFDDVSQILDMYKSGKSSDEAFAHIASRFDESSPFDWCYTNSNAMIVAASLLYSVGDYAKTVCSAVQQGFDTDCNGATAGSIFGMMYGESQIPSPWKSPVCHKLQTSLSGYELVDLDQMVTKTISHMCL